LIYKLILTKFRCWNYEIIMQHAGENNGL